MYIDKYKVRKFMASKGINTQTELAERLGITKNQLSLMLSVRYNPIKGNTKKLCDTLDVSPMSIICETEPDGYQLNLNDFLPGVIEGDHSGQSQLFKKGSLHIIKTSSLHNYSVKVLELFAGGGGLALGLEKAGLETVSLVEIDKHCCATLRKNRPQWNVVEQDISKVDFTKYKGIDVVTGGFPCQAFSYAGKKLGFEDTRGTLFHEFARCLKETKPIIFMAENVRGLISHDRGRTLKTILGVFKELGYKVKYRLFNAVNYGVPQKRERVVIIGTLPGAYYEFPNAEKEIRTIRDALKDVPPSEGVQYSERKKRVLDLVPPGGCWRHLPVEVQKSYMGKSYYSSGGRTGMARRISWDEPSLTLTCSPSQKQTERCHPDETRPFTVREYARIQTFDDDWEFVGPIGEKYKQIGNAVPVLFAKKLGDKIRETVCNFKQIQRSDQSYIEVAATSEM